MSTTVIKLEKLTFFGYHGINQEEIQNGQDFVLDLSVHYQLLNNSDDIGNVIDYMELYDLVKNTFQEKRFNLLESLGQKILDNIKIKYDSVFHMKLNIRKPSITIDNNKDFINLEVEYIK